MFDKDALDKLFADLRSKYEDHDDWDEILRQTHLGVAYSDSNVPLADKNIDPRVITIIEDHRP